MSGTKDNVTNINAKEKANEFKFSIESDYRIFEQDHHIEITIDKPDGGREAVYDLGLDEFKELYFKMNQVAQKISYYGRTKIPVENRVALGFFAVVKKIASEQGVKYECGSSTENNIASIVFDNGEYIRFNEG